MPKTAYVDIGELGWSLYLSAHLRWRKEKTNGAFAVFTSSDRFCLYRGIAEDVHPLPPKYYSRFKNCLEDCSGLKDIHQDELKHFFKDNLPEDYVLADLPFGYSKVLRIKSNKIYVPYPYSRIIKGEKEIMILPRFRSQHPFSLRNLPKQFYIEMIGELCGAFPRCIIRTMGIPSGSYGIGGIMKDNYINGVREGNVLQDFIDRCQIAIGAVGGTSALPKISLLQGVPTFIIGHERERFTEKENWMDTKVEFYEIPKGAYDKLDFTDCIDKTISFIKECR